MYPEYVLIRAARYLKVKPWELKKKPTYWRDWALTCESVDAQVEKALIERSRRNKGKKS